MATLDRALCRPTSQAVFATFDLNGFKTYNDAYGHPRGDALLVRLGARLAQAAGPGGRPFRMGGDEFCLLVPAAPEEAEAIVAAGVAALTDASGELHVSAAHGTVLLPDEAEDAATALRLADERLYAFKRRLYGTLREEPAEDSLLRGLAPHPAGGGGVDVQTLAVAVGERLGLGDHALSQLRLAAELHDIGKLAIPDAVLKKPGSLTEQEWRFVREHTVIGQRILAAVPGMREVGDIVRATHERWDGTGYGDRLEARSIPVAARIIAVCDAYAAMTAERPYRRALAPQEALAELRRCAGTQFDPEVVFAFCRLHDGLTPLAVPGDGREMKAVG